MTKDEIIDKIYMETFDIVDNCSRVEQIKKYIELYDKLTKSGK